MKMNQRGARNMSNENFPKSLIVTDVRETVIKDMLERKWLKWFNQAEEVEVKK